ncbi:DUF1257 domain-containing protein [Oscillatoria sp. CS-180]|uniref:DUF1257 domain-containing protein n=1 Tax=Oscillatoria sp. CS-180 TaxID=3021720 RepID=UPI00232B878F|nr:DUF1257 domain-containing protein [Oscillatoria sp. CS-180]MDB9526404.1 DUF1257 domain-containing protein [Oscillatoria sp. CS-180]
MSHFSHIKTRIHDLEALQTALTDLDIQWKPGPAKVRGYQGQTHTAALVIEQSNDRDVGFAWNGQEYTLVADLQFWQQPLSVDGFIRQVTQRYAYQKLLNETADQGFEIAEQQQQEDGSIRLVVQRWS